MKVSDTEALRRVATDNGLREYLNNQKEQALKVLAEAIDTVAIHRAQGVYTFAERTLKLLDSARDLR